jgi:hypothetical protein
MKTTKPISTLAGLAGAAILAIASLVLIGLSDASTATAATSHRAAGAYGWPVKPFDRPHPVRANFGDPRISFAGPPTEASILRGSGSFSFHFGIDISVPDGTPVYPVHSGTVRLIGKGNVGVSGDGMDTQYWHLVVAVRPGQRVVAYETVLGRVMKGYEHVHFSQLERGRPVNPLTGTRLGPYVDTTRPQVAAISFRAGTSTRELFPEALSGKVTPVVQALDTPALRVPGQWRDLPVAPARISWHVVRASDRRTVLREQVAFDVRTSIPSNGLFWSYYARGSRQNMCSFGTQRAWRVPGTYLYRLGTRPLDTRRLGNGIFELVVTATDGHGNSGSATQVFIVRNGAAT